MHQQTLFTIIFIISSSDAAPPTKPLPLVPLPLPLPQQQQHLLLSPQVYLTVSALASTLPNSTTTDRQLVLNWANLNITQQSSNLISLYPSDPQLGSTNPLFTTTVTTPTGSLTTNIKYPHLDEAALPPTYSNIDSPICTPFHIAQHTSTSVVTLSSCLATYPTWMTTLRPSIGHRPLSAILIPGAHDAGAYNKYNGTQSNNPITKYVITQEDSILSQLLHGIRYVDIRAAYSPSDDTFYLNHGDFRVRPMSLIIAQINTFLALSPTELIIFDVHGFPLGFTNSSIHDKFVQFLISSLATPPAPTNLPLTYNSIVDAGHNVIVGYADDDTRQRYNFLHQNVHHAWAETTSVPTLLSYQTSALETEGCRSTTDRHLWSAMVELTPTATDIILRPLYGLRGFANEVNPLLHSWYTSTTSQFPTRSNIVASDFILENNIPSIAFQINKQFNGTCN